MKPTNFHPDAAQEANDAVDYYDGAPPFGGRLTSGVARILGSDLAKPIALRHEVGVDPGLPTASVPLLDLLRGVARPDLGGCGTRYLGQPRLTKA